MSLIKAITNKINKFADEKTTLNTENKNFNDIIDEKEKDILSILSGNKNKETSLIHPKNVYGFMSVSGGAGATTITVNVAKALSLQGKSVVIIDTNILNPMVQNLLQCKYNLSYQGDIKDYFLGDKKLGQCIWFNSTDIALMTGFHRTFMDYLQMDNEGITESVNELFKNLRELFDVVLVDVATQGLVYQFVNNILYQLDELFPIWDDNIACIQGIELLKKNMSLCGIAGDEKINDIIFNKRTNVRYPSNCFKALDIMPFVILPYDPGVIDASYSGKIFLTEGQSKTVFAKEFCKGIGIIADKIIFENANKLKLQKKAIEQMQENLQANGMEVSIEVDE